MSRVHPEHIYLYDDDTVELVNLAGQLYGQSHVGKAKVDATADILKNFSLYNSCYAIKRRWEADSSTGDIMICGFDNMEARKLFFNSWLNHISHSDHPENCLFIDGRLGFSEMQIYTLTGNDAYNIKRYSEEYLFNDNEAEETVCSMKQTTYCASMIGSLICNLVVNFIGRSMKSNKLFDLPFKTYYDSDLMFFKTEN